MDSEVLTMNTGPFGMDTGMYLIDNDPLNNLQNDDRISENGICEMNNSYIGKERRVQERRINASDRRELVRYEINKAPRRTGSDRRKVNGWAEYSEYKLM